MSSFSDTLERVLDPDGIYWTSADEESLSPSVERTVQLRIDVPPQHVAAAVEAMERDGWTFTEQPDEPSDPQQRLFFQRSQNLLSETKVAMLTNALRVVFPIEGARLWTWIIVEDQDSA
ncbi:MULTISPECIES: hypothetical protein [Novosphingobium]|jgi:hypothetical protein|uniref:hypothetical protein n=1 Tax=Novosphingobium TaxID=165696 RepID=UPI00057E581C|nr:MULTISPECIES: hypothetical protein [Novosphingobium]